MQRNDFARELRRQSTDTEIALWRQLRSRRFEGLKFRRQHPIGPYIADFCCIEHKLIIEADGGQHYTDKGPEYDAARTKFLEGLGFRVLRYSNLDILQNMEGVLTDICEALEKR